jgi:lipoate-protein ligase B
MLDLTIKDCGVLNYARCLDLQHQLVEQRQQCLIGNTVLIVEHPAVITLGARNDKNRLLAEESKLSSESIDVVPIRRGGGATAHNPGQLVFYPIIDISHIGVSEYVRMLESIGIDLLKVFGVESDRRHGFPGLWVGEKKIASIGVKIQKWISFHGMAININNELEIFKNIVPCGLEGVVMTSASAILGRELDMDSVKAELKRILVEYFSQKKQENK